MTIDTIFIMSAAIPLVVMPFLMPIVSLMARKKHFTDAPNYRKRQKNPVMVTGGLVIVATLMVTLMVANVFYDISHLFPIVCSIAIFFIIGMLDDAIGLNYRVKFVIQILVLLLLFFCGNFRAYGLYGLFGVERFDLYLSLAVTMFIGLLFINAINFIDGIDGLASGIGVVSSLFLAKWHSLIGYYDMTILSYAMAGVMFVFFIFNVFSKRYKMYMGDSGSLVLGLYVFVSICPNVQVFDDESSLMSKYTISFFTALFSVPVFDLIRIVIMRLAKRQSPFRADRSHLHHELVDMGMRHLSATLGIIALTGINLLVWYLLATTGMSIELHMMMIMATSMVLVWGLYFSIFFIRRKLPLLYVGIARHINHINKKTEKGFNLITRFIDNIRLK